MDADQKKHTTEKEKDFIDGLGSFGIDEKNVLNRKGRRELLRNYLVAAKKRDAWDCIDKDKVIAHAVNALKAA